VSDPWAEFRAAKPDDWSNFRKAAEAEATRRKLAGMSEQELAAASYEQPLPPPGVTIHTGKGDVYSQGDGNFVPTTQAEAEARAARELNGRGGDVMDSLASGMPIAGPFFGRMRAGVNAVKGQGDYATNLEREQAKAKTYAEDYPVESGAAKVTGAIVGTLGPGMAAARAPGMLAAGTRLVTGAGASSLPGAIARGAGAGAIQGAASGAGETRDLTNLPDAAKNIGMGAGLGAAIGGTIPAAIGGLGKVADAVMNRGSDALSSISGKARDYALRQLSDPAKTAAQRQALDNLGPDAMLADVSPEWMGVARGAASQPGSRDTIVNPLLARDAGKNARINSTINTELGPAKSPMTVKGEIGNAFDKISPEYEAVFANAKAVDTTPVAQKLDAMIVDKRGPGQEVAQKIRGWLNVNGTDQLDPNPRTLHQVRMAIDKLGKTEAGRAASSDLKEIRRLIDDELAAKVPGIKPIDAKWADVSRQEKAYETGQKVFSTETWPDEVAKLKSDLVQPAGSAQGPATRQGIDRLSEGTRAKLEEIVGNNVNDVSALNRLIKGEGDWGRQKLATVFGADKAEKIARVLDAEQTFQRTAGRVTAGSDTAMASRFGNWLDEAGKAPAIPTDTTLTGGLLRAGQKVLGMASQNRAEENAARFASELGRLSVAQGGDRDAIVQALLARGQRANTLGQIYGGAGQAGAVGSEALTRALMERSNGGGRR
jgi:hypothetical protein